MLKRFFIYLFIIPIFFGGCEKKNEEGKQLAKVYCGSCHLPPDPGQLDKATWLLSVLPEMGPRLGIYSFQETTYPASNKKNPSYPKDFYPAQAAMTAAEWEKIVKYFYAEAPDSLAHSYPPISAVLDRFTVKTPDFPLESPPVTSYIKIDPGNHALYLAHGTQQKLRSFNQRLQQVGEVNTLQVATDIAFQDLSKPGRRSATLLNMGALHPFDVTHGSLQSLTIDEKLGLTISHTTRMDSLPRPVALKSVDINQDGKEDFVVCGYGNFSGSLFLLLNKGDGHFEKRILRSQPGSIQALAEDFNKDGRMDILALMAQGDEGIFLYEQRPDGSFLERTILRFSPLAGSVSIDLADFNHDGYPDIVYASGDNADFSKILKPYHGVYIYVNDGKWNFTQSYFFPINGCFKALARDFDLDGDIDIASISFFADFQKRPEESFVYLQNEGHFNFKAFTFPQHSLGRWLTLDAGDIDGDGDWDLVLGNMSIGPSNLAPNANWKAGPAFVLLENRTR